ncbi:MAG: hypothetical protein ACRD51_01665 [Candidatus Acidiferrum sp.]
MPIAEIANVFSKPPVVFGANNKYNAGMNRGAYSYWFRFWYPPI